MAILSNKNTRQRDFALQVPLMTSNNEPLGWQNRIALIPRYTDSSTAHTKVFTAASDYADPNNHDVSGAGWSCDIKVDWNSSGSSWYNYTYDTLSGRRGSSDAPNNGTALQDSGVYVSLYLDLAIGDGPHPGVGTNYCHMSVLYNQAGAHHQLYYTGIPTPDYTHARTFPDHSLGAQNIKLSGQNYGAHQYRQYFCLADTQSWGGAGTSFLRFINHGGGSHSTSKLTIAGGAILIHGRGGANIGADQ